MILSGNQFPLSWSMVYNIFLMKTVSTALIMIFALAFLSGCGTPEPHHDIMDETLKSAEDIAGELKKQLMDLDAFKDIRSAGLEGAEFVHDAFRRAGKSVPRTTSDLAKQGTKVGRGELRTGDLVFFRTGFFRKHVGIYLGMNRFVHATGDEGIIVSNIKDPYWKKTYWQARRILDF